ncbi:MAG: hypothetical protein KA533_03075 [Sphingobium sp.]|nr:hypothetical protein [Sphingobium sp.]MBP6110858.1 hypothetical protein [Sphingobium sp.]MBP8669998.1 hypothetical protein [Sphingobium sp.]MBP9157137.1 hypothetical protein [Sphingobium sp.]MCC6481086.1 hypothetical protein [Sphingomonadaceae bacterium]
MALSLAVPLMAGRTPTSLLPPGFGDDPPADRPAQPPSSQQGKPAVPSAPAQQPGLQLDLSQLGGPTAAVPPEAGNAAVAEELSPEELAAEQQKYDLPAGAHRSLDRVGPLTEEAGGLPENSFGGASGPYLATLLRETKAPLASRWGSILMRRALLSATQTPRGISGADWVAERAWMLVRMGEADAARSLVQSVDSDQYGKRLYAVATQAYLASADPVGLCAIQQGASASSDAPGWRMAEAMCASFSAEQGRASAILNQTERRGDVRGIDYRLTEKIVGAGANARRSVKIEWDGVDRLTAWRFGLATAANVDIPAPLMAQTGSHVWAWQARAPMLSPLARLPGVEAAARLGVFSGSALVDFYSGFEGQEELPDGLADRLAALRRAYAGGNAAEQLDGMRTLWSGGTGWDLLSLLAAARAAAALPVSEVDGADLSHLVAAMLSAGYDISAMRWAGAAEALADADGADGWAMLAVGAPRMAVRVTSGRLKEYSEASPRGRMALAGLAGLGRIGGETLRDAAEDAGVDFRARSRWAVAIADAARRGEKGTVALLAAAGMQTTSWNRMPPEHLYHIVAALHRVGLNPEARMIAAEAIMRS